MNKILVCDDEKDIVRALEIYLKAEGYETCSACNGREAVMRLQENNDICLVLRSVDPMITIDKMSRLFGIPKDTIKIIPARMHPDYYTETAPVEQLSASMACTGSFVSVAQLIIGAKVLRKAGMFGVFIQAVGALLMLGLVVLEAFLHLGLTPGMMLLLETIISLITILAVNIRRTF